MILCIISVLSCNKDSVTPSHAPEISNPEEKILAKKIKVFLCTNKGELKQSHVFTFREGYKTNTAAMDTFTDALWFAHHYLSTEDTVLTYLYPYAIVAPLAVSLYAYPDGDVQDDPDFEDFQPWFENLVSNWMEKHECSECSNIKVNSGNAQFFSRISCIVN